MQTEPGLLLTIGVIIIAAIAGLFWPEKGLLALWQRTRTMGHRTRQEDALKHIFKWRQDGRRPTLESVAGALQISRNQTAGLLEEMQDNHLLLFKEGGLRLTPKGHESALHIIRAHRLWERYLAEETGFEEAEWHSRADQEEHRLSPETLQSLADQLGNPTHDPHGDPIPNESGRYVQHGGRPLSELPARSIGRIVHIEDEPKAVYAQLVAEGLYLGQVVRIIEADGTRIRFWSNGDEHLLAPIMANNVSVIPVQAEATDEQEMTDAKGVRLTEIDLGTPAEVVKISAKCRGAERRRFMDLGILPGTQITPELRSPSGEPTAYRVRGASIALRKNQTDSIYVQPVKD